VPIAMRLISLLSFIRSSVHQPKADANFFIIFKGG